MGNFNNQFAGYSHLAANGERAKEAAAHECAQTVIHQSQKRLAQGFQSLIQGYVTDMKELSEGLVSELGEAAARKLLPPSSEVGGLVLQIVSDELDRAGYGKPPQGPGASYGVGPGPGAMGLLSQNFVRLMARLGHDASTTPGVSGIPPAPSSDPWGCQLAGNNAFPRQNGRVAGWATGPNAGFASGSPVSLVGPAPGVRNALPGLLRGENLLAPGGSMAVKAENPSKDQIASALSALPTLAGTKHPRDNDAESAAGEPARKKPNGKGGVPKQYDVEGQLITKNPLVDYRDVEGEYVVWFNRFGPGFYVIRCHLNKGAEPFKFATDPFEKNSAHGHFNRKSPTVPACHFRGQARGYKVREIAILFGHRVLFPESFTYEQRANWAKNHNEQLAAQREEAAAPAPHSHGDLPYFFDFGPGRTGPRGV
ncbi:hypothetical protein OQA88_10005 [Cercophora sp. LCS_1]